MYRPSAHIAASIAGLLLLGAAATIPAGEADDPNESAAKIADQASSEQPHGPDGRTSSTNAIFSGTVSAAMLLRVPVTGIVPGNVAVAPEIKNPLESDPDASTRGMRDFDTFNCSGCHAANGGGGMAPSLSDDQWLHRSTPANIYLTIVQGRSNGMPAFGTLLPDRVIWELVSYIQSITEKPSGTFGKTTAADSPDREQVSANRLQTPTPWRYTEPFYNGEKPN
jgi:cytochrome c oxidase cbb3-type subunit 3